MRYTAGGEEEGMGRWPDETDGSERSDVRFGFFVSIPLLPNIVCISRLQIAY